MRKVEAAAEQTAHVPPEVVWSLLSNVMVYPQWGPWRKSGYRSEGDAAAHGNVSDTCQPTIIRENKSRMNAA